MKAKRAAIGLLLVILFAVSLAFSLDYIAANTDHECTGDECKICAVLQTAELFDFKAPALLTQAKEALLEEKDFLHRVVSPGEKKTYLYRTRDITERFFLDDRVSDLQEEDGR